MNSRCLLVHLMVLFTWLPAIFHLDIAVAQSSSKSITVDSAPDSAVLEIPASASVGPTFIERYTRHLLHRVPSVGPNRYLLVTQQFTVGLGSFDGFNPAQVSVSARPIDIRTGSVGQRVVWSFSTEGVDGKEDVWTSGPLYRIDMPGCCGADSTSKYFSLDTGRLIVSSTVPLLRLDATSASRNTQFYIGAESNIASSPKIHNNSMATVFFGDDNRVLQTISISRSQKDNAEEWVISKFNFPSQPTPLNDLVLKSGKSSLLHIELTCRCKSPDVDITLPISSSGINVRQGVVSRGLDVKLQD